MRKIITILIIFITINEGGMPVYSQSQRLVLLEEFSNMRCGPCYITNPIMKAFLDSNSSKICSIRYQVFWPGYDTLNADNPNQVYTRIGFYGAWSVPEGYMDGDYWSGQASTISQASLDTRYATPSPFTISVVHNLSPNGDTIYTRSVITKTDTVSGHLFANVVIIEKHINVSSPPALQGDIFNFIMKQMLPSDQGIPLPFMNVGDSFVLDLGWKLANVFDTSELAVVSFVQNHTTKEIVQAGYSPYRTSFNYSGITTINSNTSLNIYPNPTTSLLTISLPNNNQKAIINLYDMLGEKVLPSYSTQASQYSIDLSNLSQDIYFLEVIMDDEKIVKKVVKIN